MWFVVYFLFIFTSANCLVSVNDVLSPLSVDPSETIVVRWGSIAQSLSVCLTETSAISPRPTTCLQGYNQSSLVLEPGAVKPLAFYSIDLNITFSNGRTVREETMFGTGPLQGSLLEQPWLGGYRELVRSFELPSAAVARAVLYIASAGCFDVWLDGVQVVTAAIPGQFYNSSASACSDCSTAGLCPVPLTYLNPGMSTVFSQRLLYQSWDLTGLLLHSSTVSSSHALGVRLGSCKYGLYTEFCVGNESSCLRVSAIVVAFLADGSSKVILSSDSQWMGNPRPPITYDHLYIGESYDQTLETLNWSYPNASLFGWVPAWLVDRPTAMLSPHLMLAISAVPQTTADHQLKQASVTAQCSAPRVEPISITNVTGRPGSYVFDFSRNHAGTFVLSLPSDFPSGTQLSIRMAERLNTCEDADPQGLACGIYNSFPCPAPCCPAGGGCSSMHFMFTAGSASLVKQYTPTFSAGGFRYLQLDGWPNASIYKVLPDSATLRAVPISSSTATLTHASRTGAAQPQFSIPSQPLLTSIAQAAVSSLASNMLSHPTDCPTRERRGWTGDAQVTVDANMLLLRPVAVYMNWLRTMADTAQVGCSAAYNASINTCGVFHTDYFSSRAGTSLVQVDGTQHNGPGERPDCYLCCSAKAGFGCEYDLAVNVTGSLPDIMPVNGPSRAWPGSMCWTFAFWKVAHALVLAQGDAVSVAPYLQALVDSMAFYGDVANSDQGRVHGLPPGLIWYEAYGDWISSEATTPVFLANAHYITALRMLAFIASAAGQPSIAAASVLVASEVQDLLQQQWLRKNATTGLWTWDTGSQTAQAVALAMGLSGRNTTVDADVAEVLQMNLASRGSHLSVGVVGSRYLLQALSMINRSDLALTVLNQTTAPSWGFMVTAQGQPYPANASTAIPGAVGTLWESWTGTGSTSLNHAMFAGGPALWMAEEVLGLRQELKYGPSLGSSGAELFDDVVSLRAAELLGVGSGPSVLPKARSASPPDLWSRFGISLSQAKLLVDAKRRFSGDTRLRHIRSAISVVQALKSRGVAHLGGPDRQDWHGPRTLAPSLRFQLDPIVAETIREARGTVQTQSGAVDVHWKLVDSNRQLELRLCSVQGLSLISDLASIDVGSLDVQIQAC